MFETPKMKDNKERSNLSKYLSFGKAFSLDKRHLRSRPQSRQTADELFECVWTILLG